MKRQILSAVLAVASLSATMAFAAPQDPSKSTNVKATLISNCKESATEKAQGKLTATEIAKFCTCNVEAQGRITKAQEWEIVSAQNAKKDPNTLPFIQQNQKAHEACLGAGLVSKLNSISAAK